MSKLGLAPSKTHMHIFIMSTTKNARFQKDPLKTVGGVDYTNSVQYSVTKGWIDGQTGANLNAP